MGDVDAVCDSRPALRILLCRFMAAKPCRVSFTDADGVIQVVHVSAESLYEAAVLGLKALNRPDWIEAVGPYTRITVRVHEPAVGIGIPALIPKDFFAPVAAVRRRTSRPMQWASVPKTSVDKDSDAGRPENDIGAAP